MKYGLLLGLLLYSLQALCGVMPDKSRIIYREKSKLETVMLVNTNSYPVMVQLWSDNGELNSKPEQANAPFVTTPVMFKLDAMQLSGIKIIYSGEKNQLPKDRESLFWLNIFEVPPKPTETPGVEKVALSMLTQMKIIYRPQAIDATSTDVLKKLSNFSFTLNQQDPKAFYLTVKNPSPFVASFSSIELIANQGAKATRLSVDNEIDLMVLPKSQQTFRFNVAGNQKGLKINEVSYTLIDDEGHRVNISQKL